MYKYTHIADVLIRKYGWDRVPWFRSWREIFEHMKGKSYGRY